MAKFRFDMQKQTAINNKYKYNSYNKQIDSAYLTYIQFFALFCFEIYLFQLILSIRSYTIYYKKYYIIQILSFFSTKQNKIKQMKNFLCIQDSVQKRQINSMSIKSTATFNKDQQLYLLVQTISQCNQQTVNVNVNKTLKAILEKFKADQVIYSQIRKVGQIIDEYLALRSIDQIFDQLDLKNYQKIQPCIDAIHNYKFQKFLKDFFYFKNSYEKNLPLLKQIQNQNHKLKSEIKLNDQVAFKIPQSQYTLKYKKIVTLLILIQNQRFEEFQKQDINCIENEDIKESIFQVCNVVFNYMKIKKMINQLKTKQKMTNILTETDKISMAQHQEYQQAKGLYQHFYCQRLFLKYLIQKAKGIDHQSYQHSKSLIKHIFLYNSEPLKELQKAISAISGKFIYNYKWMYQRLVQWYKKLHHQKKNPTHQQLWAAVSKIIKLSNTTKQEGVKQMIFSSDQQDSNHKYSTKQQNNDFKIKINKTNIYSSKYTNSFKLQKQENDFNMLLSANQLKNQEIDRLNQENRSLLQKLKKTQKFLQGSKFKNIQLQTQNKEYFIQTTNLNIKISDLNKTIEQKDKQLIYQGQLYQNLAKQSNQLKQQLTNRAMQIENYKQIVKQNENNQQMLTLGFQQKLKSQNQKSQAKYKQLLQKQKCSMLQLLAQIAQLTKYKEQTQNQQKILLQQQTKQQQNGKHIQSPPTIQINFLQDIKSNLFSEHISKINPQKANVTSYRMIYKFMNKQIFGESFSKFTKDKKNLLVLGKTKYGQVIGGFTSQGFGTEGYKNDGFGCLFSAILDQNELSVNFYDIKNSQKIPSQCLKDQIRFGYRQLVIKNGKVQSDFATPRHESRGHYLNLQKHSKQAFLKSNLPNQAVQLIDFQIYQITFDNQIILQSKDLQSIIGKSQALSLQVQRLNQQILQFSIQKGQAKIKITQKQTSNNKLLSQIAKYQTATQELKKNNLKSQTQLLQVLKEKQNLLQNIAELNKQMSRLNEQNQKKADSQTQKFKQEQQSLLKQVRQKDSLLSQRNLMLEQLKEQKKKYVDKINRLIKEVDWQALYEQEVKKSQQIIKQKTVSILELQIQINTIKEQSEIELKKIKQQNENQKHLLNQQHQKSITNLKQNILTLQRKNNQLQKELNQIKLKQEIKNHAIVQLESKLMSNRCYEQYFEGQIFQSLPHSELKWFVDQLDQNCGKYIKRTRLLYRKDDLSNINFHQYFDGKKDIVLLIKLKNQRVLAGYTHSEFIKGLKSPGQMGFIFSFHHKLVFGLKQDLLNEMDPKPRPVTYDEYYMMFGNSQIRLRFKQCMLFSNFGILNGFYENRKYTVDCLLGEDKERQSQILTYEIYQVKFQY